MVLFLQINESNTEYVLLLVLKYHDNYSSQYTQIIDKIIEDNIDEKYKYLIKNPN